MNLPMPTPSPWGGRGQFPSWEPSLPLHRTTQNRIRLEIVQLALDLRAWMPILALTGKARLWGPRRLRIRLFSAAAQLVTTARRRHLRFARHWPWTDMITAAIKRLEALPEPRLTSQVRSCEPDEPAGDVEPAPTDATARAVALPTRPEQPKRPTEEVNGPSRKIEVSSAPLMPTSTPSARRAAPSAANRTASGRSHQANRRHVSSRK